jgi:hypothetical protein
VYGNWVSYNDLAFVPGFMTIRLYVSKIIVGKDTHIVFVILVTFIVELVT